jgi:hypothetical protein
MRMWRILLRFGTGLGHLVAEDLQGLFIGAERQAEGRKGRTTADKR